jgi:DNA-binding response OmpR family regulator
MLDGKNPSMSEKKSTKPKILLAEDDGAMRRFLEITLQRAGYTVVSAEDGLTAMRIALSENFDAVVTDAVMPNLTGHDLCRILRQNPAFENAPLIILSGLEKETSANVTQSCADAYLVKGGSLKEELTTALSNLLSS